MSKRLMSVAVVLGAVLTFAGVALAAANSVSTTPPPAYVPRVNRTQDEPRNVNSEGPASTVPSTTDAATTVTVTTAAVTTTSVKESEPVPQAPVAAVTGVATDTSTSHG